MPRQYRPPVSGQQAYGNRTDLNQAQPGAGAAQPIRVAPGGPQGSRQALEAQQRAVPLPDSEEQMRQTLAAAQRMQAPPAIDRPTEFPSEPVTAGSPSGLGPGTDAARVAVPPLNDTDRTLMASWMPMLELLAGQPGASVATRNTIRQMRSQLPPDFNYTAQ